MISVAAVVKVSVAFGPQMAAGRPVIHVAVPPYADAVAGRLCGVGGIEDSKDSID